MPNPNLPVATLDSGLFRGDTTISVYFVGNGQTANAIPGENIDSEGWSSAEKDRVMAALASIENYINVTFEISANPNADFQLVLDTDDFGDEGYLGFFYQPWGVNGNNDVMGAFNKNGLGWSTAGLQAGGLGFSTIIHEALHGLGLDHPHDGANILPGLNPSSSNFPFGDYGDFDLNQGIYTIMSYNDGSYTHPAGNFETAGNAATPMALDIAILQEIYGANEDYKNGDDPYTLSDDDGAWVAIWDTGGNDTIRYDGSQDAVIDLRAATLQYEVGGGGFISAVNGVASGFTIANGVVIENAIGGSGDDTLTGNDADNTLTGNAGDDTILGGRGNDDIDGGANNDTLRGNGGADQIESASGTNTMHGDTGADTLIGGSGTDTIYGNSGADTISGGGSGDFLYGGRGDDTISGGAGNDRITGGMGQDTLTGGAGADTFIFDYVSDSWAGSNRRDTIMDFEVGVDHIDLAGIRNDLAVTLSRSGNDMIVQADQDGDSNVDLEIVVVNGFTNGLSMDDLIL